MESSISDQASRRIVNSDFNVKIIKMIGSKRAREIIEATHEKPMSASEISKVCNIPLTKVYRWLIKLENCKLLQCSGTVSDKGRKIRLYKSKVNMIWIDPAEESPSIMEFDSLQTNASHQASILEQSLDDDSL